jgi:hypothetical protein
MTHSSTPRATIVDVLQKLTTGIALCVLLLSPSRSEAAPILGPVLGNGEQHYYDLIYGFKTWTAAKAEAETLSYLGAFGHLVTIENAAENAVVNTLRGVCISNPGGCLFSSVWIGYSDAAVEGTFVWVTGEPTVYTNWAPGEPNNSGGNEDFAHMGAAGLWNDIPNAHGGAGLQGYVIEYPVSAVPLPPAFALFATGLGAMGLLGWRRTRKKDATG